MDEDTVHLIDILTLGKIAFTTISSTGEKGKTLKSIFEDPDITKSFCEQGGTAERTELMQRKEKL